MVHAWSTTSDVTQPVSYRFGIVGSPDTVVDKITRFNDELGGVGALLSFTFDFSQDPEPYRRHLELLEREVGPRVAALGPRGRTAA